MLPTGQLSDLQMAASSWSKPAAFLEKEGWKAEEALSDGCTKCVTVDRRSGAAVSKSTTDELPACTSPGPPRVAPGPVQPAPRDREAIGGTTACPVSVLLTLTGQRRNRQYRAQGGWNVESRLQTQFKDEVAFTYCCYDEGKGDDRRDDMHRFHRTPAAAMGLRHGARRRCPWPMRQEPFCRAIASEDCQTENIFVCRANIVANLPHKRADQSQTKRTKGWRKFRP